MITELDVVNQALASVGEAPLNEIDEDHPMVASILSLLKLENMDLQASRPWWFNLEHTDLIADVAGFIYQPGDALRCDVLKKSALGPEISVRGRRLYDNDKNTYTFTVGQKVECVIARLVPFRELPVTAQQCVMHGTVLKFQLLYDADSGKTQLLGIFAQKAFAALNSEHIRNIKPNMLGKSDTSYHLYRSGGQAYYR